MARNYRTATQPGHRICNRCNRELPATLEVFLGDKSRPLGLAYECRECHRERKKGRDRRKERWGALTPEQRLLRQARMKRWGQTQRGRATFLRKAYQRVDECDLSADEIHNLIMQPCVYCGTTTENRGLDRIDNALGHIRGNVQTACTACNIARGDRFTVDEMRIIGRAIAEVRALRSQEDNASTTVQSEDHL